MTRVGVGNGSMDLPLLYFVLISLSRRIKTLIPLRYLPYSFASPSGDIFCLLVCPIIQRPAIPWGYAGCLQWLPQPSDFRLDCDHDAMRSYGF